MAVSSYSQIYSYRKIKIERRSSNHCKVGLQKQQETQTKMSATSSNTRRERHVKSSKKMTKPAIGVLLVDPQKDFHEGGSLAVAGATADAQRVAKVIRSRAGAISNIYVTLDSHHRTHIAHGISWVDKDGNHPSPFTLISAEDAANEVWKAADPKRVGTFKKYAAALEKGGKFKVCIWPEHCLIGTDGHAVQNDVNEAIHFWTGATSGVVNYVMKGQNLDTEMYSAMAAEVEVADDKQTQFNERFMAQLSANDTLIIGGQALSHCVNFTARDIISHWKGDKSRIIVLTDCSSVVGGFEQAAKEFVEFCRTVGVQVMDSETLLDKWDSLCNKRLCVSMQLPEKQYLATQLPPASASSCEFGGCDPYSNWSRRFMAVCLACLVIVAASLSGRVCHASFGPSKSFFGNYAPPMVSPVSVADPLLPAVFIGAESSQFIRENSTAICTPVAIKEDVTAQIMNGIDISGSLKVSPSSSNEGVVTQVTRKKDEDARCELFLEAKEQSRSKSVSDSR
jgi:nicotinamidase/pyrazinamidase